MKKHRPQECQEIMSASDFLEKKITTSDDTETEVGLQGIPCICAEQIENRYRHIVRNFSSIMRSTTSIGSSTRSAGPGGSNQWTCVVVLT